MNSGPNGEWLKSDEDWPGPLPVVGCQVWYGDGSCVPSWKGPQDGVQVVVAHHPGRLRTLLTARDEYTFPGESDTKLGEEIEFSRYTEIHAAAVADTWRP